MGQVEAREGLMAEELVDQVGGSGDPEGGGAGLESPATRRPEGGDRFDGMSAGEIVRMVQEGGVRGGDVPLGVRRRCVSELTYDGLSISEIARLMGVCERTVNRDRAAIRKSGRVGPGRELGDEMLGEFERVAWASMRRLMRLVSDARTPAYAKLWAEEAVVRTQQRLLEVSMKMGYYERGEDRIRERRRKGMKWAGKERVERMMGRG